MLQAVFAGVGGHHRRILSTSTRACAPHAPRTAHPQVAPLPPIAQAPIAAHGPRRRSRLARGRAVLFAEHTRAWGWTLAYCLYLQLGPWAAGRFLRSASPGLLLPGGVGLWLPGEASPRLLATPDPYYVSWVHTLTGIAP